MSEYYLKLGDADKERYSEKLGLLSLDVAAHDPLLWNEKDYSQRVSAWPPVKMWHIVAFLIRTQSRFTVEDLDSYNSLEAYKYIQSGWLQTVYHQTCDNGHVLRAKVLRSQAVCDQPHQAWVLVAKEGKVLAGHCTCMAGLGEVCSHVSSILFKVESRDRALSQASCTSVECAWNSSQVKKVDPAKIVDIQFVKPRRIPLPPNDPRPNALPKRDVTPFLNMLKAKNPSASIFSITEPQRPAILDLPKPLTSLYREEFQHLDRHQLKTASEAAFANLHLSPAEVAIIEKTTRGQRKSAIWRSQRRGRLTASLFGDVMCTSIQSPAPSLLTKVMGYGTPASCAALQWGIDYEGRALQLLEEKMAPLHDDFRLEKAGLSINVKWSFLGASPDAIVHCTCHGQGLVEVKCPYSVRLESPCSANYLNQHQKDTAASPLCPPSLKMGQYLYQIQGQMNICELPYCLFVVFTEEGLHIEVLPRDEPFFLTTMVPKLKLYFLDIILPELLSHKLKNSKETPTPQLPSSSTLYCKCQKPEEGRMIGCKNPTCPIKWYHLKCLKMKRGPRGDWLCPQCKPKPTKPKPTKKRRVV